MWILIAFVFLVLVGIAYFATRSKVQTVVEIAIPEPNGSGAYVPKPYDANTTIPPATTTPEMPSLIESKPTSVVITDEAAQNDSSTNLTVPPGSNVAVLGTGSFEIVAKGDTGSEVIDVLIDGVKYPAEGSFQLSKELSKIRFDTPRRVDVSNVILRDRSGARDENGADTNIRVQSIVVNDNGENIRSHLFQAGRDPNYISNGLLFWGGEFTFISQSADPSAQANSTLPVSSNMGTIEIVAKGDVGNEEFRVSVDGLIYPPIAGTVLDDGTVSTGVFMVPTSSTRFLIKTPRRVDLANVMVRTTNDAIDPATGKDRNVRVQSIMMNGDGVDVRPRLFRVGVDDTRLSSIRQGNLFWGGDYTFV